MSGTDIGLTAADGGAFTAYLAKPDPGTGPGIVVLQEIFGVNHILRDIADILALQGYFAIVPDLFWRQEPGIQITDRTEAEWARAFELFQGFDVDLGIEDAKVALDHLRTLDGCSGQVGCVGYCLGGKLAYLMATRSDVDAAVGYYGVGIEGETNEADCISKPLMLHIAEEDGFVPKDAQAAIRDALGDNALVTLHSYAGCDHAFARIGGEHYDQAAADQANQRSADFFTKHLS
jgi:carboxymethylenebutenolidase